MNKLKNIALGFVLTTLIGCVVGTYKSTYNDHPVELIRYRGNPSSLYIYKKGKNKGNILFQDVNNDGRFDEIELNDIPKGDPIEQLVNLETGQEILNQLEIDSEDTSQ